MGAWKMVILSRLSLCNIFFSFLVGLESMKCSPPRSLFSYDVLTKGRTSLQRVANSMCVCNFIFLKFSGSGISITCVINLHSLLYKKGRFLRSFCLFVYQEIDSAFIETHNSLLCSQVGFRTLTSAR